MIYADGADLENIARLSDKVAGYTTNPSLLRKSGVKDYREFALRVLEVAQGKPVSFEVFADDLEEMVRQAKIISSWGPNVYVKIPITNSEGESTIPVIRELRNSGIPQNVTAVFTVDQIRNLYLDPLDIVSIFAGRIADTGIDPEETMINARKELGCKLLWASAREPFNVVQASRCGCDIITLAPEMIDKLSGFGRDLTEYSLETVKQFKRDAEGLTL